MKTYKLTRGGLRLADTRMPYIDITQNQMPEFFSNAYLPGISVLPMLQHRGEAARCLVEAGARVHEGMLIGRGEAKGAAHIHAPVSGRVLKIVDWRMPNSNFCKAVVLRMEGAFSLLGRPQEKWRTHSLSAHEIRRVFLEKGLIDMDGEGSALHEQVASLRSKNRDASIILNLIQDEPWRVAALFVAKFFTKEIVEGLNLLFRASSAKTIYCAISPKKKSLARAIVEEAVRIDLPLELVYCEEKYPMSNSTWLSNLLARYGKGSNYSKKAASGGYLVTGPSSLLAIYNALTHNVPLLERFIAVGGSAVKNPSILRIRLGTRIGDAIAECGGFVDEPKRIVLNSLIRGESVNDLDTPITKTVQSIIIEGRSEPNLFAPSDCIGCGDCRAVCPLALNPEHLLKLCLLGSIDQAYTEGLSQCIACSSCSVVCPSRIPIGLIISKSKNRGSRDE